MKKYEKPLIFILTPTPEGKCILLLEDVSNATAHQITICVNFPLGNEAIGVS